MQMSFSQDVKEELVMQIGDARHCRLAELAAILTYGGQLVEDKAHLLLRLQTESHVVARKYFTLLRKTFNINIEISRRPNIYLNHYE